MSSGNRRLRDPRELSAVAHPVRLGILEVLTIEGPLTASELGDRLDESPANCSWHLRKLAEHGFVEEAEGGRGRRRPWQVSQIGLSWGEDADDPAEHRAGQALSRMLLERWVDRAMASRERTPGLPKAWSDASYLGQTVAWVTAEELDELGQQVSEVMQRFVDRIQEPCARPEGAQLCELVAWGGPVEIGAGR